MKYIIYTLGCKVNQYETQAMETILNSHGHTEAKKGETADAVIINTCAVTAEAGRKSRQTINRLREENPHAVMAVSGCYSQLTPDSVRKLGADIIFGTGDRAKLIEAVENAAVSGEKASLIDKPFERRVFEDLPAGAVSGHTRALLKIQDGCHNFCSYCIIPYTRGRVRSLPVTVAADKAAKLNAGGFKELVITGIEIASYGMDLENRPDLADVICAVSEAAPDMRLRLGSIEPSVITEDFCRRLSAAGNVCRHFHLSLQSGCDAILKAMNRKYDTARFYESVLLLRKYFPGCALTADLIMGFPGETDENVGETLEFLEKVGFADVHIFPYSRRPGTPADKLDGQIERAEKARRAKTASAAAKKTRAAFLAASVGKTLPVLFETFSDGMWQGHSDTYLLVKAEGEELRGSVENVLITEVRGDTLFGKIV